MNIKDYIEWRGVAKTWLAAQLGISLQALYKKFNGESKISPTQAERIRELLRMTDAECKDVFREV
jgi:hypothetical protein